MDRLEERSSGFNLSAGIQSYSGIRRLTAMSAILLESTGKCLEVGRVGILVAVVRPVSALFLTRGGLHQNVFRL